MVGTGDAPPVGQSLCFCGPVHSVTSVISTGAAVLQPKNDPRDEFATRLKAYEKARDKGLVFQAIGTLGGITLRKKRKTKYGGRIGALLFLLLTLVFFKAVIFYMAGPTKYNSILLPYASDGALHNRAINAVFGAGPVTIFLADRFGYVQRQGEMILRAILPNT
jgi:hypothetical protein